MALSCIIEAASKWGKALMPRQTFQIKELQGKPILESRRQQELHERLRC